MNFWIALQLESASVNVGNTGNKSRESLLPFHQNRESIRRRSRNMAKVSWDEFGRSPALDGIHWKDGPAIVCSKLDFDLPTVQKPQVKESLNKVTQLPRLPWLCSLHSVKEEWWTLASVGTLQKCHPAQSSRHRTSQSRKIRVWETCHRILVL